MLEVTKEEIERGWKFLNEGKEEEALKLADIIEKKEDLSPEEKLKTQILKAHIYSSLGNFEQAFKIAEETYREYDILGDDFLLIDALNSKLWFLKFPMEILNKSTSNLIERGENIFKSISNRSQSEVTIKEARFLYIKGGIYYNEGKYDLAMDCNKRALMLIEQFNIDKLEDQNYRRGVMSLMGNIYMGKGELNLALKYYEKSLAFKKKDTKQERLADVYDFGMIGHVLYSKGDLDNSLKNLKQGLTILKNLNLLVKNAGSTGLILYGIIKVLIAKGDQEGTQHYLHRLKQLNSENPVEINHSRYNLTEAKILKSSTRSRDRAEAERIFKEIIENEKQPSWVVNAALIEICDFYLKELRLTNDLTFLDEIGPFISQLQQKAEKENSYSLLAKTKSLQSRIALIQMNMGDARRFLTQAQEIADKHGYQHLAQTISIEHDNLLGQLDVWENLKKTNAPLSERMNLASLSGSIENLIEAQEVDMPELSKEQPVLLLILMEGGILLLSYPFTDEWKSNEEQFGSFLTAFMSFSNEFFTEGLDRAKFGQYTVLMETIPKFSICYLYKGQTYLAKKKLGYFIERLQNIPSIIQTLDKFSETSQVIELKNFPFLEGFITEIFMSNNPGNITT